MLIKIHTPETSSTEANQAVALHLLCSGECIINTAQSDYEQLMAVWDQRQGLNLDLSGIEEIDSSGFQHLLALKKKCNHIGQACNFFNPSQAVQDIFELYFFSTTLNNQAA